MFRGPFLVLIAACASGGFLDPPQERQGTGTVVAFVDVNVLPMDAERVLARQTVVVDAGRIVAVGPIGSVAVPADATIIEGRGAFHLMPGLADFHTHAHLLEDLVGYAANGVTSILQMGQSPSVPVMQRRAEVNAGELLGPHVYAGWFVDGPGGVANIVTTDQAARDQVAYAKAQGYEFVKVYNSLTTSQFSAIVAEARVQGLAVIGHGVRAPGMETILRGGQVLIAHGEEYIYTWFGNGTDPSKIRGAVELTEATGAFVIGNPSAYEAIDLQWGKPAQVAEYLGRPEARYLHPVWKERWRQADYARRLGNLGTRTAFVRTLTRALHDGGVPILLGTDSPGIPGMYPGYSIHDEIRNLLLARFTPFQALEAGTRVAGDFIQRTVPGAEPFGMVKVGHRADLILLTGNPLEDVGILRKPAGVMIRGSWWSAARLTERLDAIAATP